MSTEHGTQPDSRRSHGMFRTKTVEQSIQDTEEPEHALKKSLSALDLTVFGVGVVIGTGIFVLTGKIAKEQAGPAVALSFVVAGVVCALAALCYAEFASTVPVAGSAYTFSYASLGELPAWIIGWDLILELALGCAVVAVGWSGYVRSLLDTAGVQLPAGLSGTHEGRVRLRSARLRPRAGADRHPRAGDEAVLAGDGGGRRHQGHRRPAGHRRRRLPHHRLQLRAVRPAEPSPPRAAADWRRRSSS